MSVLVFIALVLEFLWHNSFRANLGLHFLKKFLFINEKLVYFSLRPV
jgi:hypothetical protein